MSDGSAPPAPSQPPAVPWQVGAETPQPGEFGYGLPVTPSPRRRTAGLIALIVALFVLAGVALTVVLLVHGSNTA